MPIQFFPFTIGDIFLTMPESAPAAGDNIDLLLDSCDFIAVDGNPLGYKRFRQTTPQVSYTIAGGPAVAYSLFEPKYEFEFGLYLDPNKWMILHSIIEEQHKRIRTRSTTVVGVRLLDLRQTDVYRLPRTRARDGGAIDSGTIPSLVIPTGSEASYSWFEILFNYEEQYYDFFLKNGNTETSGLLQIQLSAKELDIVPTSEDTALFT